ncbi:MAG: DUF4349 domain-containing protein, partial [Coriobacteriia bacterium]|nr:DUF4349 domain-containing protein [Coriobacteriia bacterium]
SRTKRVLKVGAVLAAACAAIAFGWVAGIVWSSGTLMGDTSTLGRSTLGVSTDSAATAPASPTQGSAADSKSSSAENATTQITSDGSQGKLVVRSGALSIKVDNLDDALAAVRKTVAANGGEIANLTVYSGTTSNVSILETGVATERLGDATGIVAGPRSAVVTLRIPADKLAGAQDAVAALGTVLSQSLSERDVTQQHIDMRARLANLIAEEGRLREFLAKATKVSEMLEIERELSRVRGEIESMQAQVGWLESQAAMATLTLSLSEPGAIIAPENGDWRFSEAVTAGIQAAAAVIRATITVVLALSPLLLIGLVLWIARLAWRRLRDSRI